MRTAVIGSNTHEPEGLRQEANTGAPHSNANIGQSEDVLVAEIADVLDRKLGALRRTLLKGFKTPRTLRHDIACDCGFVWYPQPFNPIADELPRASRLVAHAWLEKAKRDRHRARARRAVYCLLVLVIGAGAYAVSQTPVSFSALRSIEIDVA